MQICSKSEWGVNVNCVDRVIDRKLHVFATKHEANTYNEYLIHSNDDVSI